MSKYCIYLVSISDFSGFSLKQNCFGRDITICEMAGVNTSLKLINMLLDDLFIFSHKIIHSVKMAP